MSSADKAEQILKRFEAQITSDDYPGEAMSCALIHVEEIISLHAQIPVETLEFYIKVKEELKLI